MPLQVYRYPVYKTSKQPDRNRNRVRRSDNEAQAVSAALRTLRRLGLVQKPGRKRWATACATSVIVGLILLAAMIRFRQSLTPRGERGVFTSLLQPRMARIPRPLDLPPLEHFSNVLYSQGLSHSAFRTGAVQFALAKLAGRIGDGLGTAAVVGAKSGDEMETLARAGFAVHAFEPATPFHDRLAAKIRRHALRAAKGALKRWDIHLHSVALGSVCRGRMNITYSVAGQHLSESVPRGCLDDFVAEELSVLSIHTGRDDFDVLKGAANLFGTGLGVRSIWIHVRPCSPGAFDLLRALGEHYVLFDFVPWGLPKGAPPSAAVSLRRHPSFLKEDRELRPAMFKRYCLWLCRRKLAHFAWVGTDIVAIRRDLATPRVMASLSTLANDLFLASAGRS